MFLLNTFSFSFFMLAKDQNHYKSNLKYHKPKFIGKGEANDHK